MEIPGILAKIVETKKRELVALYQRKEEIMLALATYTRKALPFKEILTNSQDLAVIAEVKKASPSAGIISPDFDHIKIARAYEAGGACAISVLTDEDYFKGHADFLREIRQEVNIPLLRKDFIIDELQIFEARILGADTYLLIVAILDDDTLKYLIKVGLEMGMTPLVEIHDAHELKRALNAKAEIIGVNNRDLRDFSVDLGLTARLSQDIPKSIILIGESGIKSVSDAKILSDAGCKGILVGETLMREGIAECGHMIKQMRDC
jgi:indole-3-glycerol phosphate synthase